MSEDGSAALVDLLPNQLRWSTGVTLPEVGAGRVLVCGMGGSAIAADYVQRLAAEYGQEVAVHRDYGVPPWAHRERPLIVVSSYSGDTEEAISAYHAAAESGLARIVITTGGELGRLAEQDEVALVGLEPGFQPRAAFGMAFGVLARLTSNVGAMPDPTDQIRAAADRVDDALAGPDPAIREVRDHVGSSPVAIYAAEPLGAVAYRWKTQFNENANRHASWGVMPEIAHNELVPLSEAAWGAPILLRDEAEPAAIRARLDLLRTMVTDMLIVRATGASRLERMLYLTAIGDAATVAVAEQAGVDAIAVDALDHFKRALHERY